MRVCSKTVLLVDDAAQIRKLVTRILIERGFTVITAEDGAHAMQVAADHEGQIDLLLSDLQMPGMTGVELATKMQTVRPETQVVLMSSHDPRLFNCEIGCRFLAKPFSPDDLHREIADALDSDRPAAKFGAGA